MKAKFVPTKDHKFVEIFVDGEHVKTCNVQTDDDGHEYIYVPNLFRPEGDILEKHSFLHRIGDMVEHIRRGWGDAIQVHNLIVRTEHLYWFLDRSYGEELHKKSIAGWKNTEFAWAVFQRNNTFGPFVLNVHGDTKPILVNKTTVDASYFQTKFYDTEAEAQAFINGILDELRPLVEGYLAIKDIPENQEKIEAYYNEHLKDLTGIRESVWLMSGDKTPDENCCLYVGQIIKKTSTPYTKRSIFMAKTYDGPEYFMCKGDALDCIEDENSKNYMDGIHYDVITEEHILCLQGPESKLFTGQYQEKRPIYRLETQGTCGKWYLTIDECFDDDYADLQREAEVIGCKVKLVEADLHPQDLQPVNVSKENPYMMLLKPGKRGDELVGYANLRPDEVGTWSGRKKVYFPDRSCKKDLCAGMVRVTEVVDRGNYGFIKGTMVKYTQPDEEKLAEFLMEKNWLLARMTFVQNPYWGSAIKITPPHNENSIEYIAVDSEGELNTWAILPEYDHAADKVTEVVETADFICIGYTGKTHLELCKIVPRIEDTWRYNMEESIRYINDDFDDAIACGLIKMYRFRTFDLCVIDPDKMCKAASILQNDLIPVLEKAKEINEAAAERITNLKRKGKL